MEIEKPNLRSKYVQPLIAQMQLMQMEMGQTRSSVYSKTCWDVWDRTGENESEMIRIIWWIKDMRLHQPSHTQKMRRFVWHCSTVEFTGNRGEGDLGQAVIACYCMKYNGRKDQNIWIPCSPLMNGRQGELEAEWEKSLLQVHQPPLFAPPPNPPPFSFPSFRALTA